MSSGVKVKSSVSHGLSLQMALLHLKWQQIRKMELEAEELQDSPPSPSQNYSHQRQHEEICSAA